LYVFPYTPAVSDLSEFIFTSSAFKILRALHFSKDGLGLRELSELCQISLGATQDNTKKLQQRALIVREKTISRVFFSLNLSPSDLELLDKLVELEQKAILKKRADNASTKNLISILETANELEKVRAKHESTR